MNVIRDVQRRNARHRALLLKLAGRNLLETDDVDRIEAAIDAAGTAERLRDALDAIPAGEQEMLRLVAAGQNPEQAANHSGARNDPAPIPICRSCAASLCD